MEKEKIVDGKWLEDAENLMETYRDLLAVRVVEQTSLVASISVLGIVSLIFTLCFLLFAGLGIAWWIGQETGNTALGLFIVGGSYLFLFLVVMATANKILLPAIRNIIIKKIYEQD